MINKYVSFDSLGKIGRGRSKHRPRNASHLYGGSYPFIQTADISNSDLFITKFSQTYSEAGLAQSKLWQPGVLCIVNAGVGTGDNAILQFASCFPDSIIAFQANKKICEVRYIKYYLDSIKNGIRNITMGATQDNLSVTKLLTFKIPFINYKTQRKIAAILSAYDDLIENNNRRIAILEKMAEELYREWFVRLRFPGYESAKIVRGVPEGWAVIEAGKYFKVIKGRSYTSDEIEDYEATENHKNFITLKNFKRGGGFRSDAKKYYCGKYNDNQIVSGGSLVLAVTDMTQDRAVIGRIARIPVGSIPPSIISCDVVKIEPVNITESILYSILRFSSYSESLKEFANGANVLHLKPELASKQKIIMPSKMLCDAFDEKFYPLLISMDKINNTLELLTTARDRLLSRLMSGKIDVADLDIRFPASMMEADL